MTGLVYFVLVLLPLLLSGPLPAILWFRLGASQMKWSGLIAALVAVALNVVASVLMLANLDGLLPAGFIACGLMPFAALATLFLSRELSRRSVREMVEGDPRRRWLRAGIVALPALQLLNAFVVVLIAPALCEWGLRSCSEF